MIVSNSFRVRGNYDERPTVTYSHSPRINTFRRLPEITIRRMRIDQHNVGAARERYRVDFPRQLTAHTMRCNSITGETSGNSLLSIRDKIDDVTQADQLRRFFNPQTHRVFCDTHNCFGFALGCFPLTSLLHFAP
jgi:hypothetical protein